MNRFVTLLVACVLATIHQPSFASHEHASALELKSAELLMPFSVGDRWVGQVQHQSLPHACEAGMKITRIEGNDFWADYYFVAGHGDIRKLQLRGRFDSKTHFKAQPQKLTGGQWQAKDILKEVWDGTLDKSATTLQLTRNLRDGGGVMDNTLTKQ